MEVYITSSPCVHAELTLDVDLHLGNVLFSFPSTFDQLSVEEFGEKFGKPDAVSISRIDGKPLSPNVPAQVIVPLYLGKHARDFTMDDAQGLILSDFGEAFSPATEQRLGKDATISLAGRAPEALFEPEQPLSYASDIWSLACAIWEILGMKFIFSESETQHEIIAQQIDILGSEGFPEAWRLQWERLQEDDRHTTDGAPPWLRSGQREKWPELETAFEEFVQKYRRKREATGVFEEAETQAILALMRGMLRFRPEERLTMDEVLKSEWMLNWALPQLEQR
jgi:serine/threonine protein kinase